MVSENKRFKNKQRTIMNIDQIPASFKCYSITEEKSPDVVYQSSLEIHKHQVNKGYQILSKNDFTKVRRRVNLGIFNKKTNFIIGEEKSLLVWDNKKLELCSPNTSDLIQEKNRYFLIYDMNFIVDNPTEEITIYDKTTKETINLKLNSQFGYDIGLFLKNAHPKSDIIPDEFQILKSIIQIQSGKISINKQILINSNAEFLLGILEGYIGENNQFILQQNINIYNFTYILNLLGAQYSIRTINNLEKQIRFKLPAFLRTMTSLKDIFFRIYKYKFLEENKGTASLTKNSSRDDVDLDNLTFFDIVNSGLIELIPIKDLVFVEIENSVMYDLTMERADATNYSLPGTPVLKNSDGDILSVYAIHTKDASDECVRKLSVEYKTTFMNLNDSSIQSWGAKLDSILGLYGATK
jgi:hypothetical protein